MKIGLFTLAVLFMFFNSCKNPLRTYDGIYRYYYGEKEGYKIWIIDGYKVRQKVYKEFVYGGNEQRYTFVPKGEIWIDHAISSEEFELTLAHELNERRLMAKYGLTYDSAHANSLNLELKMRRAWKEICQKHEESLPLMPVTDFTGVKEISNIPDHVRLKNIYRIPLGKRNGIQIWVVDGYHVRASIYPDFGFSGNDAAYNFIPPDEIWIDGQVSCEETEYAIQTELKERDLMKKGKSYNDAYEIAIVDDQIRRNKMEILLKKHPALIIPRNLTNSSGIVDPSEK